MNDSPALDAIRLISAASNAGDIQLRRIYTASARVALEAARSELANAEILVCAHERELVRLESNS